MEQMTREEYLYREESRAKDGMPAPKISKRQKDLKVYEVNPKMEKESQNNNKNLLHIAKNTSQEGGSDPKS